MLCCAVATSYGQLEFNESPAAYVKRLGTNDLTGNLTSEQRAAIQQCLNRLESETVAHNARWIGKVGVLEQARAEGHVYRVRYDRDVAAIKAWPNGKNPNAKPEPKPEPSKPQPPQKTDAEKKAEENAKKIENADCKNCCPYDNLDKIKDLNLTPEQQQKIDALRKLRQMKMAQSVKMAKTKRYSTTSRRSLYRILRYFFSLYNYRIRYTMTPNQIAIFDVFNDDVVMNVDRLEDLLAGMSEQEVFSDDKNAPEMVETGDKKRLTRTNFAEYDEFRKMLVLDDEQLHELAALDSDARGNFEAAVEAISKDKSREQAILEDADKEFASIQAKIRKLIPRGQKEDFNTLMLLLFDALEFPSQNMASFAAFEMSEDEVKKLDGILQPFLKSNTK
ncbi:MAG: hypothetical protein ACRC46_09730, partial [Thermoguttaceae bacterium]